MNMELLIQFGIVFILLLVGLIFGRMAEQRHFRYLKQQELILRRVLVFNEKQPPKDQKFQSAELVVGSVVIAEDYFKRMAAALKGLVGGRLTAYESLMDRGRREAIIRMKQAARECGAEMIFNVRIETARLSESDGNRQALFAAEFIAYGTALVAEKRA